MFPLLLIPVGVWIVWSLAKKRAYAEMGDRPREVVVVPLERERIVTGIEHVPSLAKAPRAVPQLPPPSSPQGIAQYLEHLRECTVHAAALNMVRQAAIAADISALQYAPQESVQALHVLAQPMDWLTLQRDLNLLGATPQLEETGDGDAATLEALRGLQERFNQEPTGEIDPGTAVAVRYAVGIINAQNQMGGF